jgi:hypothetical protein
VVVWKQAEVLRPEPSDSAGLNRRILPGRQAAEGGRSIVLQVVVS